MARSTCITINTNTSTNEFKDMEGSIMTASTGRLKSMIHEAFRLQENTLNRCQCLDLITNERCNAQLAPVCVYAVHQIIIGFALQAPSNQQTHDIAVHNLSIIPTLTLLARKVLCLRHTNLSSVSTTVLQWLVVAAENVQLFELHSEIRDQIPQIRIALPQRVEGTYTIVMDEALFSRVMDCHLGTVYKALGDSFLSTKNLYLRRLENSTETLLGTFLQQTTTEETEACSICLDGLSTPITTCTQCRQHFHSRCINAAAYHRNAPRRDFTCPLCRVAWFDQSVGRNFVDDAETQRGREWYGDHNELIDTDVANFGNEDNSDYERDIGEYIGRMDSGGVFDGAAGHARRYSY